MNGDGILFNSTNTVGVEAMQWTTSNVKLRNTVQNKKIITNFFIFLLSKFQQTTLSGLEIFCEYTCLPSEQFCNVTCMQWDFFYNYACLHGWKYFVNKVQICYNYIAKNVAYNKLDIDILYKGLTIIFLLFLFSYGFSFTHLIGNNDNSECLQSLPILHTTHKYHT